MKNTEFINYIPEIIQSSSVAEEETFIASFMKIFEALVIGREDANLINGEKENGIEEIIDMYISYLSPALVPVNEEDTGNKSSDFLNFLASWVALNLDQNWELHKKRRWLQKIVSLYKRRGTKTGLVEYLNVFVEGDVVVDEPKGGFIVGEQENSIVGENTFITDAPAYYFRVKLNYGFPPDNFSISEWKNQRKGIRTIVDLEKPAHTYYKLHTRTPGIIVGGSVGSGSKYTQDNARSTVGIDTLIWKESKKFR